MATMRLIKLDPLTNKINKLNIVPQQNKNTKSNVKNIIIIQNNVKDTQKQPKKSSNKKETNKKLKTITPVAVERRNARERNRVKRVNNGYNELRSCIPVEIVNAYEKIHNRREINGKRKFSKVETLRMAVEYIRSLENLLNSEDENCSNSNSSSGASIKSYNSSLSPTSPSLTPQSAYSEHFPYSQIKEEDEISNAASISPQPFQYVRLIGTDTYQLVASPICYEDKAFVENLSLKSEDDNQENSSALLNSSSIPYFTNLLNLPSNYSISSPDMYSERSQSPNDLKYLNYQSTFQPLQNKLIFAPQLLVKPLKVEEETLEEDCGDDVEVDSITAMEIQDDSDDDDPKDILTDQGNFQENASDVIKWWQLNNNKHMAVNESS